MKKIVITGMGAVTPVGVGVDTYWKNITDGVSGIDTIRTFDPGELAVQIAGEVKNFNPSDYLPKDLIRKTDPFMQYAYIAAEEALKQSKLEIEPHRTGIVMGTALAGLSMTGNTQVDYEVNGKHVTPKFLSKVMGNIAAAHLSINYGIKGPSMTVSTACSSGGDAITLANMLLQSGAADTLIVMGGESAVSPLVINSLAVSGALSKSGESRPFDTQRSGFVIGEGGGALVLETEEHALARGAKIIAELLGCGNNTDAYNPVAPHPEGIGGAECMRLALKDANISPDEIGYINAHGTATLKGDIAESKAINSVFGGRAVPVSSTKGATGHLMGAGGITECIACVKAIQTGIVPPTVNCDSIDPECHINVVAQKPEKYEINAAMSNALGFGGQNSSVIVGKYNG